MERRAMVDIFHSYLHRQQSGINNPGQRVSPDEFINNNREILRHAAAEMSKDYNISLKDQGPTLRQAIMNYMRAEGILASTVGTGIVDKFLYRPYNKRHHLVVAALSPHPGSTYQVYIDNYYAGSINLVAGKYVPHITSDILTTADISAILATINAG